MLQASQISAISMSPQSRVFGTVEAGGTKIVCAIADEGGTQGS
jgi:hypothetical protein